jgi:hypothetical protein
MTDTPPEGWFPDPLGRAPERFWDGTRWTDRVREGLVEWSAPLDAAPTTAQSVTGTHTTPATRAVSAGEPGDPLRSGPVGPGLAAHLQRPRPGIDIAVAVSVAAGVLGVVGAYALTGDSAGRPATVVVSILLFGVAYALALVGPTVARPAALVGGLVAPAVLVFALLGDELEGRTAVLLPTFLLAAIWMLMFVAPGMRAAPILIAASALSIWVFLVGLTVSGDPYRGDFGDSGYLYEGTSEPIILDPFSAFTDALRTAGAVTLVFALVVIVVAAVLDRRGWHVAATPLLGVTVVLSVTGLYLSFFGSSSPEANAFMVAVVGVVLTVVGGLGGRRGSSWIGVGLTTTGLVTLLGQVIEDPVPAGIVLILCAAGLLAAARPVAQRLSEPGSG